MSNKDFKHRKRVATIAHKTGVPKDAIEKILSIQGNYIKDKLTKVDIKNEPLLSEDEFNDKLPIIRIHPIGYLYPNYKKYQHINKKKDGQSN